MLIENRMNLTLVLLLLALTVSCQRQQTSNGNTAAGSPGVVSATYRGVGTVEAVDPDKRTVKINHEEIKGYMEAMSMDFHTRDPALLNDLKPGDRVGFTLENTAGIVVITGINKL